MTSDCFSPLPIVYFQDPLLLVSKGFTLERSDEFCSSLFRWMANMMHSYGAMAHEPVVNISPTWVMVDFLFENEEVTMPICAVAKLRDGAEIEVCSEILRQIRAAHTI